MKNMSKKGFTVVELVIVIAVIAVLAAVLIPTFSNLVKKANESAYLQERTNQQIEDLAEKLATQNEQYLTWEDFEAKLAEQIAKIEIAGMDPDQIKATVQTAVDQAFAAYTGSDKGLTEDQVKKIIEKALEGSLTTAQVEAIVNAAIAKITFPSAPGEAQIKDIVNTAVDKAIKELQGSVGETGITKEQMEAAINKAIEESLAGIQGVDASAIQAAVDKALAGFDTLTPEDIKDIIDEAISGSVNAAGFAGGEGTEAKPYLVATAEQLQMIKDDPTKSYKLVKDIDMSGVTDWEPIGTSSAPFSGTFDGANYAIKNWTTENVSFFGYVKGTAEINKGIDDSGNFVAGNITEDKYDTVIKNLKFEHCDFTIDYNSSTYDAAIDYGAIIEEAGYAYIANIEVNNCSIEFGNSYRSGIVIGDVYGSHVNGLHLASSNNISVTLADDTNYFGHIGLLIGTVNTANADKQLASQTIINNCVNDASVTMDIGSANAGYIGGILGQISAYNSYSNSGGRVTKPVIIINCVNNGNITVTHDRTALSVSGICGGDSGGGSKHFINCANNGNIKVVGPHIAHSNSYGQLSGICAYSNGPFINCENNGNLTGDLEYIGGICAALSSNLSTATLDNCSNSGVLTGGSSSITGELVAKIPNNVEFKINLASGSGTYTVPATARVIVVEGSLGYDTLDFSNTSGTVELNVSNATIALTGTANSSISIIGENNTVTVASGVVLGNVKIEGAGSSITNNGTVGHLTVANTSEVSTNNGTVDAVNFTGSNDLAMEFVNNGTISAASGEHHSVMTQHKIALTFTNNGTICGKGTHYALLFYGDSTVVFNAGASSKLNVENAKYYTAIFENGSTQKAASVTINVASGAEGVSGGAYYGIATHSQVVVNIH